MSNGSSVNLKSGYVPVDDVYLYKTGIRGRKKYMLYVVVFVLFLVALANLLTTFILLGVLQIGYGMEHIEFVPPSFLIRFLTNADFDKTVPTNGVLGGFHGQDLSIIGNGHPVILQTKAHHAAAVVLNLEQNSIVNVESFKVVNPNTGKQIFSTEYPSFGLPKAVKKLSVKHVRVNKVASPVNRRLSLESDYQARLRGNEGLHMRAWEVVITAGKELYLKSRNSSIWLDGHKGTELNMVKFAKSANSSGYGPWQYKLCVCIPSGKIFRIPSDNLDSNCANVVGNPCQ